MDSLTIEGISIQRTGANSVRITMREEKCFPRVLYDGQLFVGDSLHIDADELLRVGFRFFPFDRVVQ